MLASERVQELEEYIQELRYKIDELENELSTKDNIITDLIERVEAWEAEGDTPK